MWEPSPTAAFGSIDVNHNYVDDTGIAQTILWGDLVGERPLVTQSNLVPVSTTNPHQLELTLVVPFNCYPSVHIRYEVTQGGGLAEIGEYSETISTPLFVKNLNFTTTGTNPLVSTTLLTGDSVQVTITYENHVGSTQNVLVYTF